MEKLSVLIVTYNEADRLPDCLASVAFADEIVVVDSGSDDGTARIAEEAGARVLVRTFAGHADQKNWGLDQVTHRWVLIVDADERVRPELRDEIVGLLRAPGRLDGYHIRRRNTFMGKAITGCGWQRDRVLRFFDTERGRYEDRRVHEEVQIDGRVGELGGRLDHHSYRDLDSWVAKSAGYAWLGAEEAHRRGRRYRAIDLLTRPLFRFLKEWLLQGGWRDGTEGFVLCVISAYGVFLKYTRLRELDRGAGGTA